MSCCKSDLRNLFLGHVDGDYYLAQRAATQLGLPRANWKLNAVNRSGGLRHMSFQQLWSLVLTRPGESLLKFVPASYDISNIAPRPSTGAGTRPG